MMRSVRIKLLRVRGKLVLSSTGVDFPTGLGAIANIKRPVSRSVDLTSVREGMFDD